jgi:hypothetical protein
MCTKASRAGTKAASGFSPTKRSVNSGLLSARLTSGDKVSTTDPLIVGSIPNVVLGADWQAPLELGSRK